MSVEHNLYSKEGVNKTSQRLTSSLSSFDKIVSLSKDTGVIAHIARQYLSMYNRAITKPSPTILELGTREGISTSIFLEVCSKNGGNVFSVDIAREKRRNKG